MKIITLITRLIRGGAQRIALDVTAHLRDRGHEAVLWCGPQTGPEGSLHEEAAARGVPVRLFDDLRREIDLMHDARALRSLTAALRDERPDWLHTHSSKAGILGREAARRAGVVCVAHTVHGWGFTRETPWWLRRLYVSLERRQATHRREGDLLLFVSATDREEGWKLGILPPDQGTLVLPGINLEPFADSARMAEERKRIRGHIGCGEAVLGGFLGRLAPQKDPALVLDVAERLSGEFPSLRWLMVGEGPLGARLRRQAEANPVLPGRVHWAGLQADPLPWLSAMDLLVLPSRWEGTPLTVMEAMAAGLPIVASDIPGVRALLQPGETLGVLAEPGSVVGFTHAVAGLVRDESRRRELGEAARRQASAHFSRQLMLERIEALYLEVPPRENG
jgi:glycosyltransferase involved in cell wall biosynthesis